jgi:hypothetical protein
MPGAPALSRSHRDDASAGPLGVRRPRLAMVIEAGASTPRQRGGSTVRLLQIVGRRAIPGRWFFI